MRVKRDYSNATYQGFGLWSGDIDEVIAVGTRMRPNDNTTDIQDMLREWRNLSNQERLVEAQLEIEQFTAPEDCSELLGLVDFFRDVLDEIKDKMGSLNIEYGTLVVFENGNTSFYRNQAYTNNSSTSVENPIPSDASIVVSVIHNHPRQGLLNADINLENRYPSDVD